MPPTSLNPDDARILDDLLAARRPALLVITAAGCPTCATTRPVIERLAAEYAGRADVVWAEAEQVPGLLRRVGLARLPGLVFIRGGRELARLAGAAPEPALRSWLEYTVSGGVQPPVPHGPSVPAPPICLARPLQAAGYEDF